MTYKIIGYILLGFLLFVIEILYFRLARKYKIYDVPNHRSSHNRITIRGGGVIFWVSLLFFFITSNFSNSLFFITVTVLAFVSFYDDIKSLPNSIRFSVHIISTFLILNRLGLFENNMAVSLACIFMGVGILNAFNFMDGINGITGIYSIIVLVSLLIINNFLISFEDNKFIAYGLISLLVFGWFNFRKYALCFAGDVGSFTIAFFIVFFIFKLIFQEKNYIYLLLLLVYGVDVFQTLLLRLFNGENIFKAHKKHLFQILVNEFGHSHLRVSMLYALIQLIINALVIISLIYNLNSTLITILFVLLANLVYFVFRKSLYK